MTEYDDIQAMRARYESQCVHCGEVREPSDTDADAWQLYPCTSDDGHETTEDYLARDSGDAPASRYGRSAWNWQPVAVAVAIIVAGETEGMPRGLTPDVVDHAASLVVNDHDDVEHIIVNYGPQYGYGANALLSHDWHVERMPSPDAILSVGDIIIDGAAPRSTVDRIDRLIDFALGYVPHPTDAALLDAARAADDAASPGVYGDYDAILPGRDAGDVAMMLDEFYDDVRDYVEQHIVPEHAHLDGIDPGDVVVWCSGCTEYVEDGGDDDGRPNRYDMTPADYEHADGCDRVPGGDE